MNHEKLLRLINAIYSAAADPSLWPAAAHKIKHAIGGHSVNLALEDTQDPKLRYFYSNGVTQTDLEYYEANCICHDKFTDVYNKLSAGSLFLSQQIWTGKKELYTVRPYEEFYEKIGYAYFNAGLFYKDEDKRGWLSVARCIEDPLYNDEEYQLMQALLPHLQRAFMINIQMLEAQQCSQFCLNSLEHLSVAVLLLSSTGCIIKYNTKAQKYLCCIDAAKRSFRIHLPEAKANCQLHQLISATLHSDGFGFGGIVPFFDNGIRKTVLCFPWRSTDKQMDWLGQVASCIIFILSPSVDAPPAEQLQQTFNLSKAEVPVLQGLLDGIAVSTLADQLFVTEATVRFHIRNLLRKTDSRNQAELISKVFKLTTVLVE